MFSARSLVAALQKRAGSDGLWRPMALRRGTSLLQQGEPRDCVFVLCTGLVKLTYVSAEGDEWIKSLIVDTGLFGSADGSVAASRFGAAAVEACTVAELPSQWLRRVAAEDAGIAAQITAFTAWLAERKLAREEALLCRTPEERYRDLIASEPELLARLPQGDIARFLRVTPIAFSRIKKRVKNG
jgi:CRP-like cAMP-binding protein